MLDTLGRVNPARRTARGARFAVVLLAATALALSACSFGAPPADQSGTPPKRPSPSGAPSLPGVGSSAGTDAETEVLATGLPQPWAIAFLPDGSGVVTERKTGRIVKIGQPQTRSGLTVTKLASVPGIDAAGDGGLLGVAVSPHYATDKTLYVYYSTRTDNRIGAVKVGRSGVHVLVKGIPHGKIDNGGALGFGPDGYLYAATGDTGSKAAGAKAPSQNPKSLAGKVLRMTPAGKPAKGSSSLVYASGFRDVEGLAWDSHRHLYAVDEGARTDNVLVVQAGRDYGWPSGESESAPQPIQTLPAAQSTCSGIAVLDDALALACTTGKRMWLMQITTNADVLGTPAQALANSFGRLRGVAAAPDGSLWVSTSNTDGHGTAKPQDDHILRVVLSTVGAGVT